MQRFVQAKDKKKLGLPAMTIKNLELFQTMDDDPSICRNKMGSLFYHLNHTLTKFGCRQLKDWISAPLVERDEIEKRLDVVQHFVDNHDEYQIFREMIGQLPDLELLLMATINNKIRTSDFAKMCILMDEIKVNHNSVLKCQVVKRPKLLQKLVDQVCSSFDHVTKILKYIDIEAAKHDKKRHLFKDWSEYPKVGEHLKELEILELGLDKHKKTICKSLGWSHFEYNIVSGQDYLIEVKSKDKGAVPDSWTIVSSTKQGRLGYYLIASIV